MKSKEKIKHDDLVTETIKMLKPLFQASADILKPRIEDLISRDYLEYKKLNPYLIEHIQQIGNADNVIPSNMIRKSIDQKNGMEFTYAFWFNIDAVKDGERMNILKKGNNDCPGIYVSTNSSNHDNTMNIEIDLLSRYLVNYQKQRGN